MELAFTLVFFIFIYGWFSRYNFFSLILFIWTFNSIRNIRNHIIKNKIENSPNPFLQAIKITNDWTSWIWYKLTSSKSNFWLFQWIGDKYNYFNTHFLELLEISKKESLVQFSSGFNYTLNTVLMPPPQITSTSITQTNKEMVELNKAGGKKNSLFIPFSLIMGGIGANSNTKLKNSIISSAEQTIKTQEEINKIKTIIQDLDTQKSRINLYDSDEDNERIDSQDIQHKKLD